jgi:hypothetical protein
MNETAYIGSKTLARSAAEFTVTSISNPPELAFLNGFATISVGTGGARIQTYATADECAELAGILLRAAITLRHRAETGGPA